MRLRDKRNIKENSGEQRTDEQTERYGVTEGEVGEKERGIHRSTKFSFFPEAIITGFDAVGHQNLIKIYISF